jgi:drug/metabolite transporter (DMT)-like permease|tara:strand:- start:1697 stop:2581 length:885 start_codon:yes stop_codon:yes gene_type:complete
LRNKPAILDWIFIIGLSAVWSSAFVFIKKTAPIFGAVGLVFMRLLIASIILGLFFIRPKHFRTIRENIVPIFIVGATNVTIPFMFFALAALYINAGSMAVVNGSTPLFAFLFSILLLGFAFRWIQFLGILIGIIGLCIFVGMDALEFHPLANLSAVMGAVMYGVSMVYIFKLNFEDTKLMAAASMIAATICIAPLLIFFPIPWNIVTTESMLNVVYLATFCTGLAYIPYFILIRNVGPVSTSIIAMLVPIFGMLWAYVLLGESITLLMSIGCLFIVIGILMTNVIGNNDENKSR